jgi:hypothetical protein
MPQIPAYAYVDDSGDVGTRLRSKRHFALGGYFMLPADGQSVAEALATTRAEFGMPPNQVLHFGNYAHERRVRLAQMVRDLPVTAFVVVLCKKSEAKPRPWTPDKLYNWTIRLALEVHVRTLDLREDAYLRALRPCSLGFRRDIPPHARSCVHRVPGVTPR